MSITSPNGGRPDPDERGRRWQLDDAIEASSLPPLVRHLLHTLLRRADTRTGIIPDEYQPSLVGLKKRTGLRHETLLSALRIAEEYGWLSRARGGGRGNRTRYKILDPANRSGSGPVSNRSGIGPVSIPQTGTESDPFDAVNRSALPEKTGPDAGPQLDQRVRSVLSLGRLLTDRLPEVAEDEREKLAQRIVEKYAPRNERPYLRKLPETDVRAELETMRSEAAASNGHPIRRPWCGRCDQRTRLIEIDGQPARCPDCHPLTAPDREAAP